MKNLLILFLASISFHAQAIPTNVYQKLVELNACWEEQPDVDKLAYPECDNRSEREWIRTHLTLVEQTLRARNTAHLSEQQKAKRAQALYHLNQYWHEGNFPVNDQYNYRTPIFIDKYDNFCAVGYLVKATGFEHVSRKVAAQTNLAYVREMNYPELFAWANEYGFTVDELAWIQPQYIRVPHGKCNAMGKGTDGEIFELYVDKAGEKLFVGGAFSIADSIVSAHGIAYIKDSNNKYTWHNLGDGVNGTVHAIAEHDSKIFIAGTFNKSGTTSLNNVAYWDGTKWNAAGCIDGVVKDMVVMGNELYACGDFNMCDGTQDVNFAKWTGSAWQAIPGLKGRVNTMHVVGNELILGGYFDYGGDNTNLIKWYSLYGYVPYSTKIENEVMDIEPYKGTYYISCRATISNANMVYYRVGTAGWVSSKSAIGGSSPNSFNTLCAEQDSLWMGGDYYDYPPMPSMGSSWHVSYTSNLSAPMFTWWGDNSFYLDGPVNKFVLFKGALVGGGKFSKHLFGTMLNHIFFRAKPPVPAPPPSPPSIPPYANATKDNNSISDAGHSTATTVEHLKEQTALCTIYPNPAHDVLIITNNFKADKLTLYDLNGRSVFEEKLNRSASQQIALPQLAQGIYIVEVENTEGVNMVQRITIR